MPDPDRQPAAATQISDAVSRVVADHTGRGPTSIRTTISGDLITSIMRGTFTKAEQKLMQAGQDEFVKNMRLLIQRTMDEDLVSAVEEITGRKVEAFLSDHHVATDIAAETFVLFPEPRPGSTA